MTSRVGLLVILVWVFQLSVTAHVNRANADPLKPKASGTGKAAKASTPKAIPLANRASMELGGVKFQIVIDNTVWRMPRGGGAPRQPVSVALRITNGTPRAVRFSRFDTMKLVITRPGGEALSMDSGRNRTVSPKETDYPVLMPGENVTFSLDTEVSANQGKATIGGGDGFGGVWRVYDVPLGQYFVSIEYANASSFARVGAPEKVLSDVWTGSVTTPGVRVRIAPQADNARAK